MSNNHLLIGLGGTGGNVLKEFRKNEYVRNVMLANLKETHSLDIDYLYIDSNDHDLKTKWTVLGHDVTLPANRKKSIRAASVQNLLTKAQAFPSILPWIGDPEFVAKLLAGQGGTPGANQRRRFGRLLFAVNCSTLLNDIKNIISEQEKRSKTNGVNIHIFCSLGGGTGSGGIVDLVLLLRDAYRAQGGNNSYPINIYTLVTDNPGAADVGHFKQNEYATLRDINLLMVRPNNSFELLSDHSGRKYQGENPIERCYIVTDRKDNGEVVSKDVQERILSDWLFEIITCLATNDSSAFNTMFKSFSGEDILPVNPAEPLDYPARSYMFSSLGFFRWSSPEHALKKYAANVLGKSILTGILYNNYQKGEGYLKSSNSKNKSEFDRKYSYESMSISENSISLEDSLTNDLGFFKTYEASCSKHIESPDAKTDKSRTVFDVKDCLERANQSIFKNFNSPKSYYESILKTDLIEARIEEHIREKILLPIQNELMENKIGLQDVLDIVTGIISRIKQIREDLVSETHQQSIDQFEKDCEAKKQIAIRDEDSFLSAGFFVNKEQRLRKFVDSICRYKAAESQLWALRYVSEYCSTFIRKMNRLGSEITQHVDSLKGKINDLAKAGQEQKIELPKLSSVGSNLYIYNAEKIEKFISDAEKASESDIVKFKKVCFYDIYNLKNNSNTSCSKWIDRDLVEIYQNIDEKSYQWGNEFREIYEKTEGIHLCPGILATLLNDIGTSGSLKQKCEDFMKGANVLVPIDGAAPQPSVVNAQEQPLMPKKSILIEIPKIKVADEALNEFRRKLELELKNSVQDVPSGNVFISESTKSDSEIVVTVCVSYMAARFISIIGNLAESYKEAISPQSNSNEVQKYFANLDDTYISAPSLLLEISDSSRYRLLLSIAKEKEVDLILESNGHDMMKVDDEIGQLKLIDIGISNNPNITETAISKNTNLIIENLRRKPAMKAVILNLYKKKGEKIMASYPTENEALISKDYSQFTEDMDQVYSLIKEIWR